MRTVAVAQTKANLTALLVDVARGEEIAITRHGQVVARLVPENPRMAAEPFRAFWADGEIDLDVPSDRFAESVAPFD